ncbi:hypothetical protein, partial [Serratia marcescens]|uniref:hypothetical protein n=1 Tax=Serratia marcescens TaxID=615 RepID=UPI003CF2118D
FILLYLAFRRADEALLILMSLPFALVGGIWFLYWQGFHMSVATGTGWPASWIYVDARGRDMVSVVNDIKTAISEKVKLRPGTSVAFSGQFELLEHANKKLKLMVPMTVMI